VDRRDDSVVICGEFQGAVDFGGGPLIGTGGYDMFVAKYSSGGAHQWSKSFGGVSDDLVSAVSVDNGGNVALVGNFIGSVNFGTGTLTYHGVTDMFIARYNSAGACQWSTNFGSYLGGDGLFGVASDNSGNVIVSGIITGLYSIGGDYLWPQGGQDILLAKFSPTGAHVWSHRYGGNGYDYGYGVATDSSGNVFGTGYFVHSVDFGGGAMNTAGWNNGALVKLTP